MNAFLPVIRWPLCLCKSSLEQLENVVIGDLPGAPLEYVSPDQSTKEEGSEGSVADHDQLLFQFVVRLVAKPDALRVTDLLIVTVREDRRTGVGGKIGLRMAQNDPEEKPEGGL